MKMSNYLIDISEHMEREYKDVGLTAEQWTKLMVCGPIFVSDAIQSQYEEDTRVEKLLSDSITDLGLEAMKYEGEEVC